MTCNHVLEEVEALAGGDLPGPEVRAHLESCRSCAALLATARRIEECLRAWPVESAPPRFTQAVLQRIRRERWQSEQRVDRLFNLALGLALLIIVIGAGFLLNIGSVLEVTSGVAAVLGAAGEEAVRRAAPSAGTYLAATGLLASALGMWWWADLGAG